MYYLSDVVCASILTFSLGAIVASLFWRRGIHRERRAFAIELSDAEAALISQRVAYTILYQETQMREKLAQLPKNREHN